MKIDQAEALKLLSRVPWLKRHTPDLAPVLVREGHFAQIEVGQWAQAAGDSDTGLLIVLDGALDLYFPGPNDRVYNISQIGAGATLGQSAKFGGGPRTITAVCAERALVLKLPDAALLRMAKTTPDVWRALAAVQYHNNRHLLQLLVEVISLAPRQRLAHRLLVLQQNRLGRADLTISQQKLAEMVGLSRKTANGYLTGFEAKGLISLGYGGITIRDMAGLRRMAESP